MRRTYVRWAGRDRVEAANLFDVLERRIVPLFYDRKPRSVPRGWVRRIRSSLKTLGPKVSATRMLREYVEWAYDPAANAWADKPVALPEKMARCKNAFYDPELNAHFVHAANDSREDGSVWAYRYKRPR